MAKVGIVMGSDSDMPIMAQAAEVLEQFGIDFEMTIISAHREPDTFFEYAKSAESKGMKVIIAGAGKAAHLPGMCAAIFPLPVIGIPMKTSDLGGVDSLYSIVQMPSGIPVATVAINGGKNAGILAAKILAASDPELLEKLKAYSEKMKTEVESKAEKLDIQRVSCFHEKMTSNRDIKNRVPADRKVSSCRALCFQQGLMKTQCKLI